ncbi:hypothetical protein MKX79_13235 [Viridibacillus sp. FSL R5-0468]|uniref:hypothetical protein n=1 Tax=Viridibacillus sp. FSL R5-0468 TaxID=2921640 RepID=UPI0030FC3B52
MQLNGILNNLFCYIQFERYVGIVTESEKRLVQVVYACLMKAISEQDIETAKNRVVTEMDNSLETVEGRTTIMLGSTIVEISNRSCYVTSLIVVKD